MRTQFVAARKDLIDFAQEHFDGEIEPSIANDIEGWAEELATLQHLALGNSCKTYQGINPVPEGDSRFREIGPGIFRYDGTSLPKSRGIWTYERHNLFGTEETTWTQIPAKGAAKIILTDEFKHLPIEEFTIENVEANGKLIKENRRRVYTIEIGGQTIFAKHSSCVVGEFSDKPRHRLTGVASFDKLSAVRETELTMKLNNAGIPTAPVVGFYESAFEDVAYFGKVDGVQPDRVLPDFAPQITDQDARILARLCRLGHAKQGFRDFDDKIFDGKTLHLIDVDEIIDLYHPDKIAYERILSDPVDDSLVQDFRRYQRSVFIGTLKDTIFSYQDTLLPTRDLQERYADIFLTETKIHLDDKEREGLFSFDKNYMTKDQMLAFD